VLRQRLLVEQDCQKMSIAGLGGTGKTRVALELAYEVKKMQPDWSVFWLSAVSMESFEQACARIVQALCIPQTRNKEDPKELVKEHLSSSQARRWLVVVDNADDPDILFGSAQSEGIIDYLPESEGGVTVYTTRTLEVAVSLTRGDVLELGAMNRRDATDFLSKSLVRKELSTDQAMTDSLLDELACLPLAIAQAAAYLNKHQMTITGYLQRLRSTEQDFVRLMSSEFRDDTRYMGSNNAVATTWVVSFSQIRKHNAVAVQLLEFVSCVEPKAVPRSLLPGAQSKAQMEEAIGTLCGYSFMAMRNNDTQATSGESKHGGQFETEAEELYDIHPLVHLATKIWVKKHSDAGAIWKAALRHVADVFPSNDYENRAVWRVYLPHALRLLESNQEDEAEELSELSLRVGRCLLVDGRIREAVVWLEKSYQHRSQRSIDDSGRLSSQYVLAGAYQEDGQVKKAVELLEAVVKVRNKVLAEEHPDRLVSQHALAIAYYADGQVKKAVELLEAVVKAKETLAAEHPSRLASQHALARAYQAGGQVKKAALLFNDIRAARNHPSEPFSLDENIQSGSHKAWQITQAESSVWSATLVENHDGYIAGKSSATDVIQQERQGDDECMSMESNDEDIASQVAAKRTVPEILAVRQFGFFFAELEELRSLHKEAFSRFGTTRFQENYRRILKRYVLRLQDNARIPMEKDTVLVLRSRTNRRNIAQQIVNLIQAEGEGSSKPLEELIRQPVEKLQLEDWAKNVYTPQDPELLDTIEVDAEGSEYSGEESDGEACGEERHYPTIIQAERFLRTGFPFQMLVQDIRLLILPRLIREVVEHSPKDSIRLFSKNDTSLVNKFKAFVEDNSNMEWDWWPLTPRVPDLPSDKMHIRWTVSALFAILAESIVSLIQCSFVGSTCSWKFLPNKPRYCSTSWNFFKIIRQTVIVVSHRQFQVIASPPSAACTG
jgi:tetratricopeptide (TPR) repeat protein